MVPAALMALAVLAGCSNPTGGGDGGGTADKSALEEAIGSAQNAKSGVVSSSNGSSVPIGTK